MPQPMQRRRLQWRQLQWCSVVTKHALRCRGLTAFFALLCMPQARQLAQRLRLPHEVMMPAT
jgi:hypothetical protein